MMKITLDPAKMTDQEKTVAIDALARILYPAKAMHVPTLVAVTADSFNPKSEATETTEGKKG